MRSYRQTIVQTLGPGSTLREMENIAGFDEETLLSAT